MFLAHQKISKRFARMKAAELLEVVGIDRAGSAPIPTSSPAACDSAW